MNTNYNKVTIDQFARHPYRVTAESRYWNKYKKCKNHKLTGAISCIDFNPVINSFGTYDFAVTSSTRVTCFDGNSTEINKTISRFKGEAYSGKYRNDGKLLVAGSDDKIIRVFDMNSRVILRTFDGHNDAIKSVQFTDDRYHILSGSDDHTVRMWDMSNGEEVIKWNLHNDYVRCVQEYSDMNCILSGGYDHYIYGYDYRSNELKNSSLFALKHKFPIQTIEILSKLQQIAVANDNLIYLWDIRQTKKELAILSNHQKTITTLSVDSSNSRLLTGSLDHMMKVYDLSNNKVVHSKKFPHPILSINISPDNKLLTIGSTNGQLLVQKRDQNIIEDNDNNMNNMNNDKQPTLRSILGIEKQNNMKRKKKLRGGTKEFFERGVYHQAGNDDYIVASRFGHKRLSLYDKCLKEFRYADALDAAIETGHAVVVISVINELLERGGLHIALKNRNIPSLTKLLRFINKNITNPNFSVLIDVSVYLLELYGNKCGQLPQLDELMVVLQNRVRREVNVQQQLLQLQGAIDLIIETSSNHNLYNNIDDDNNNNINDNDNQENLKKRKIQ